MSYTHHKEWMFWINDAKKEDTHLRRMDKAIQKLMEREK